MLGAVINMLHTSCIGFLFSCKCYDLPTTYITKHHFVPRCDNIKPTGVFLQWSQVYPVFKRNVCWRCTLLCKMSQLNLPPHLLMIRMYYSQPMLDPVLRPVSYLKLDFLHHFKPKLELHILSCVGWSVRRDAACCTLEKRRKKHGNYLILSIY